jgi:hypothetical protein
MWFNFHYRLEIEQKTVFYCFQYYIHAVVFKLEAGMPDVYEKLYNSMLKELEESEANPVINELISQSLPNSSEATDFDSWRQCTERSVTRNWSVIEEWSLMKHEE